MISTKDRLLREMAVRPPHIRNLLPVAAVVFDALDRSHMPYSLNRSWQLAIGTDHIGKFRHPEQVPPRRPSRLTIVRRDGTGQPVDFFTVDDAIAWRANPILP